MNFHQWASRMTAGMVVGGLATLCGCGNPPIFDFGKANAEAAAAELDKHRTQFRSEGDSDSLRWLFANQLATGMSLDQVSEILGKPGEQVHGDTYIKAKVSGVRRTDETYRWGPDNKGQVYYLFFRDEKLTAFNPDDYRKMDFD
ncbi:hypothetical protein [Thalassoroseus pseudoceratinae]|uniref:hypothetical protein n=1 Tax=Thalassoroseus pseudoceratinae TaxID=2713176 RepID=UPI00142370BC|nr:hypothetical protein [Thalassoroseus pseudoceratinae]